jgi:FMN phosphatase YigB (HAD superfamily)
VAAGGRPIRVVIFDVGGILVELGCAPAEAVFTDDNPGNVEGARRAGMHAIHYRSFAGFTTDLARLLGSVA